MNLGIKTLLIIVGVVLTVVGFFTNNWKIAVGGNSTIILSDLFL